MWLGRKGLWAKAWRSDASFHTNNMIESYHNQLESFYLIRSPNKCVGRVVYTLVNVVLCDYRIEHVQVKFGLKVMPLTTEQSKREKKADEIELNAAQIMVTMSLANDQVTFFRHSFTEEDVEYKVNLDRSQEFNVGCSCLHMPYLCKHIFLVSRTQAISYSGKSVFSRRPAEDVDGLGDEAVDIIENKGGYQAILREQQEQQ